MPQASSSTNTSFTFDLRNSYYLDDVLAIEATKRGDTFAQSVAAGKTLMLCEVEIKGKQIGYGSGKWAASGLRVIEELGHVTID